MVLNKFVPMLRISRGIPACHPPPPRASLGGLPPKPPPPLQTKVIIVGKNEICNWENLIGPFLVHKSPPPPILPPPPAGVGGPDQTEVVACAGPSCAPSTQPLDGVGDRVCT